MKSVNNEGERQRIGRLVEAARISSGLSREELAERSGMKASTIAKIEQGRFNASIDLLTQLLSPIGYEVGIVMKDM